MNKLTCFSLNLDGKVFKRLLKYLFDDSFEIDSEYAKHSECHVTMGATVDLDVAADIVSTFNLEIKPEELVGTWAVEGSSDYSNGFYWDCVDEALKVEQVTETIKVTKWKPIQDAEPATKESVQPFPGCKK